MSFTVCFKKLIQLSSQCCQKLLPNTCLLCHDFTQEISIICIPCQTYLPILNNHCQQCAQFFPPHDRRTDKLERRCGTCQSHPRAFDRTYALFPYQPPIIKLITALKFQHQLKNAYAFAKLLTAKITNDWYIERPLPDIMLPIPLHPKRLRERGFNQALEIAKPIANALKIPIDIKGLTRVIHTKPQSGLPAHHRKDNMQHAFLATKHYAGMHIALIDDVMTTGHTLNAAALALKRAGAKQIDIWCCARRG